MKIIIEHFSGDRPQFNVSLANGEGKQPFLTIKGVRLMEGTKGQWLSWPAKKNDDTGKWWNHVYASDAFNEAVIAEVRSTMPKPDTRTHAERKRGAPLQEDDDSSIPF